MKGMYPIFIKKILFNTAILALLLLVVWLYLLPLLFQTSVEKEAHAYAQRAENSARIYESEFDRFLKLTLQVESNPRLGAKSIGGSKLNMYYAQQELAKIVGLQETICGIYFYNRNEDHVITTASSFLPEDLPKKLSYTNWPAEEILRLIKDGAQTFSLRTQDSVLVDSLRKEHVISLLCSIPVWSSVPYGKLLVLVNVDEVERLRQPMKEGESFFVLRADGSCVISQGDAEYLSDGDLLSLLAQGKNIVYDKAILNGRQTYLSVTRSIYDNLFFVSITPAALVNADTDSLRRETVVVVLVAMVLEMFLILFFARRDYMSFRHLASVVNANLSRENLPVTPFARKLLKNEYTFLDETMLQLIRMRSSMVAEIRTNTTVLIQSMLNRIVCGQYDDLAEFLVQCAHVGLDFQRDSFLLLLSHVKSKDKTLFSIPDQEFQNCVDGAVRQVKLFTACQSPGNILLCVFNLDKKDLAAASDVVKRIYALLYLDFGDEVTMCQSAAVADAGAIPSAYQKLMQSLQLSVYYGQKGIVEARPSLKRGEATLPNIQQLTVDLQVALAQGRQEPIRDAIDQIIKMMRDERTPMYPGYVIYSEALQRLLTRLKDMDAPAIDKQIDKLNPLRNEWDFSITTAEKNLRQYCERVCTLLRERSPKIQAVFNDTLLYIEKNLLDPNFSLQKIAEDTGMSESAFSHMFKRYSGINFIVFINRQKIDLAKSMLLQNRKNVAEVAAALGYSSSSNFTRMFRQYTGLTPKEIRDRAGLPQDDESDDTIPPATDG